MVKFMVMFGRPADLEAFEMGYNEFLALVERIPSVQRRQVVNVLGSPRGAAATYRILEVYFTDNDQMNTALRSPAGQEAGQHLNTIRTSTVEMLFAEVFEEQGGNTVQSEKTVTSNE